MKTLANYVGAAIAVLGIAACEPSLAGPPRSPYGGFSHPTYSSMRQTQQQQQASSYRGRTFASQPTVKSRRSFSYQPSPDVLFKAGERVTVASEGVHLMLGRDIIATLNKGQELTILKVQGQWLGTSVAIDGQTKSGWVAARDVNGLKETQTPKVESDNGNANVQRQPTALCGHTVYKPTAPCNGQATALGRQADSQDPYGLHQYNPTVPLLPAHEWDPNIHAWEPWRLR